VLLWPGKARAELDSDLYHVITRGNVRRQIFNSRADYQKFLSLLAVQKSKLPFFLYAYYLMSNHMHLLRERQASAVRYRQFVAAGITQGHCEEFYAADEGRILRSEEFIDATIRQIGVTGRSNQGLVGANGALRLLHNALCRSAISTTNLCRLVIAHYAASSSLLSNLD